MRQSHSTREADIERVLESAQIGYFNLDVLTAKLEYGRIHTSFLHAHRVRHVVELIERHGLKKSSYPILLLVDPTQISNLQDGRPNCYSIQLLQMRADSRPLECIAGQHRLAAFAEIRANLLARIAELGLENAGETDRLRGQLQEYSHWPVLLYRRGEWTAPPS